MTQPTQAQIEQAKKDAARIEPFMKEMMEEFDHDDFAGILIAASPFVAAFEIKIHTQSSALKFRKEADYLVTNIGDWFNDKTKTEDQKFKELGNTIRILRNLDIAVKNARTTIDDLKQKAQTIPGIKDIYEKVFATSIQMTQKDL